eukprot:3317768-Ditylum_brightwellii.AAC.1
MMGTSLMNLIENRGCSAAEKSMRRAYNYRLRARVILSRSSELSQIQHFSGILMMGTSSMNLIENRGRSAAEK